MNKQEILDKLPERIRDQVTITDKGSHWAISHPFVDEETLFALTREAVEKLGGKYNGYYTKQAHYEIPKDVTPHIVSMDESKPPNLEVEEIGVKLVNVDKLVQSPFWCRELNRKNEEFKELVQSIRKYGVQGNLLARSKDNRLELVFGHRRLFAARQAGLKVVPVKIRDLNDEEALLIQFDENDKQKQWSDVETAHYLETMMKKFECTQEALAEKLNKSQSWVSRHLAMLSEELRDIMPRGITHIETQETPIEVGEFTERQARGLLKAPLEKREEILKQAREKGKLPSARTIRDLAQLHKCDVFGCLARTDVTEWNGREIYLCPKHMKEAKMTPEKFLGLQRSRETVSEMKVVKPPPKVKESWEFRKAHMQTPHPEMELLVLEELSQFHNVLGPATTGRKWCLLFTETDIELPQKTGSIYLDGPVHKGKEERDEKLREKLRRRHGRNVQAFPYTPRKTQEAKQKEAKRLALAIKEAYENA